MPRGGARTGAGRKGLDPGSGVPLGTYLVTLSKPTMLWLRALGGGSLSLGIREAARLSTLALDAHEPRRKRP